jgi:hypothetical protein
VLALLSAPPFFWGDIAEMQNDLDHADEQILSNAAFDWLPG